MKKEKLDYGIFCEVYGKSIRNLILELILCQRKSDFAIIDVADFLNISKPIAYKFFKQFEKEGIVLKSRVIGGTQLYKLNKKDKKVKLLSKSFKDCLNLVVNEAKEKYPEKSRNHSYSSVSLGSVSAKGF